MSDAKIDTMIMITGREYEVLRAEVEKLRAVLDKICNGPRDADLDYVDLFVEVKLEARAAITQEKRDE